MRSACVLEWLAERFEVYALVFRESGSPIHDGDAELAKRCRRVAVVELPFHSKRPLARIGRNLSRAARGVPPLVDRFFCPEAQAPLESLLEEGPFELAVFEHFWSAPWIRTVRPHCRTAILDLHNGEPEFCRAMGGPLAAWFARCAARWEARLLPLFDQIWDTARVSTGLPLRPVPEKERVFDIAFSATWAYPPNRDAARFFFRCIWPLLVARRPGIRCAIIGRNPEALPRQTTRDPRVLVTGPVEDSTDWLGLARVAVAPMRRGAGTSVKIVEAWAAGCAVVSTSVGGRGYHAPGVLVLADSPGEFASAVLDLLADDARCRELSRAGRRLFETKYCWPAVHARMDALMPLSLPV